MDAVKILGSLLGGGSMSSNRGGQVIGDLLGSALGGGVRGAGGLGDVLGAALGDGRRDSAGGGLGNVLGGLLGGGAGAGAGDAGGLGGLLSAALGGSGESRGGGGLGSVLGAAAVAAIARYAAGKAGGGSMPDLGSLLGSSDGGSQRLGIADIDEPALNAQAELMVEAMIYAARADGRIDAAEERAILEPLGDLDEEEAAFVRAKLKAPVDANAFARRVPTGLRDQVYGTSLLAVELDERSEALYLRDLAQALGMDAARCNAIHQEMGAPQIFR